MAFTTIPDTATADVPTWANQGLAQVDATATGAAAAAATAQAAASSASTAAATANTKADTVITTLLPDTTDLNTLVSISKAGDKYIPSTAADQTLINGLPADAPKGPGVVEVKTGHAAGYGFTAQTKHVMGNTPGLFYRNLKSAGNFNAWEKFVTTKVLTPGKRERNVAAYQAVATGDFKRRRGGRIGTGGLAAIAFRFDHNPAFYNSKAVAAKMRELALPATMNLNSRGWTGEYSNPTSYTGVTQAQVQDWALYDGLELANHGATHAACDTEARLFEEIQTGADELRAAFPRVAIEQWHAPGSTGTVNMGFGYGDAGNPEEWGDYYAGNLILANHAYAAGYGGGKLMPMIGEPTNGLNHYSFEESSAASTIAMITAAQNQGASLKLMMHPNVLDTAGKITTADLFAILEYAAAERDAGRLLVLTTGGLLMADSTINTRHNLVRNAGLAGTTQWAGLAGWTLAGGEATTTTGGLMFQTFNLSNLESHTGGVREMTAQFKSTAGADVTLQLEDSTTPANYSVTKTVTLPGDGQWHDVRRFVTLPMTGTTGSLTLRVGRASGGDVAMRKPGLVAA